MSGNCCMCGDTCNEGLKTTYLHVNGDIVRAPTCARCYSIYVCQRYAFDVLEGWALFTAIKQYIRQLNGLKKTKDVPRRID